MNTLLGVKKEIVLSEGDKVLERKAFLLAENIERKQLIYKGRLDELKTCALLEDLLPSQSRIWLAKVSFVLLKSYLTSSV